MPIYIYRIPLVSLPLRMMNLDESIAAFKNSNYLYKDEITNELKIYVSRMCAHA